MFVRYVEEECFCFGYPFIVFNFATGIAEPRLASMGNFLSVSASRAGVSQEADGIGIATVHYFCYILSNDRSDVS